MNHVKHNSVFLSADGGTIDFVRDGEVLSSVAVPPGRVPASDYLDLLPDGAELHVSSGLSVVEPRVQRGYSVQSYGKAAHDSGANPDYQPTSASRLEMQMRVALANMQQATSTMNARSRALDLVERIPDARSPAALDPSRALDAKLVE